MKRRAKVLDISGAVDAYLGMTQVCLDAALGGLKRRLGSRKAAVRAWDGLQREESRRRNERSLVRPDHGGRR